MLPYVTYPATTESQFVDSFEVWYRKRQRSVQKAPYNLPLPFLLEEGVASSGGSLFTGVLGSPKYNADQIAGACNQPGLVSQAANKSYEDFRSQVSTNAALGVDFVEYRQSLDMVVKRVGALVNSVRALKRGDLGGALRYLNPLGADFRAPGKRFVKSKTLANAYLEVHFGWQPLVQDIYDSIEVLHNPVKQFASMKGRGKTKWTDTYSVNQGSVTNSGSTVYTATHKQGGFIKSIPVGSLHTLEQFGLLNPATLVWEVIPFSFVVDWFASVGDVLRSYSDFAGMTLINTYNVSIVRACNSGSVTLNPGYNDQSNKPRHYAANGIRVVRSLNLTGPVFSVKQVRLPSVTRAATAISLLTQMLGKSR